MSASSVLSHTWRPIRQHKSFYDGGKICAYENKAKSKTASKTASKPSCKVISLCDEDVHIYTPTDFKTDSENTKNHAANTDHAVLQSDGDGILTFTVNAKNGDIVTSHRSTLLKHWEVVLSTQSTEEEEDGQNGWFSRV